MIENPWIILALFAGGASLATWLAQKTKLGGHFGAPVIALVFGMILINVNLIPAWSSIHDLAFSWLINLAIPLLLFKADFRKIIKLGPKLLLAFALGTVGTMAGAFIGAFALNIGPETWKAYGMYAATYIGGSVNLATVGTAVSADSSIYAAINASDVIVFFFYTLFLLSVGKIAFFKKRYPTSEEMGLSVTVNEENTDTLEKSSSMLGITTVFGAAIVVAAVGEWLGGLVGISGVIFSTTLSLILASTTKIGQMDDVGEKVGNWFINIFLVVIGATAVFRDIVVAGPKMLFGAAVVIGLHCLFVFLGGRLFKLPLDFLLIASSANVGGPTTAPPVAAAYGWKNMIAPAVLLGLLGYILGTYLGFGIAYALRAILI